MFIDIRARGDSGICSSRGPGGPPLEVHGGRRDFGDRKVAVEDGAGA
jgi:hypothetical protein